MLPEEWKETTLGELGKWVGGGTPNMGIPEYWERGVIPWVSPKDMKGSIIHDSEDHITEKGVSESATNIVPINSILLVTRSGILRKKLPIAITAISTAINQDIKCLVGNKKNYQKYLFYYLECKEKNILLLCRKVGTTVESINFDSLKKFPILLPPLPEQQKIAEILTAWDKAISTTDALVENSRQQKKALMQQLLTGKKRLAGFSGEWKEKKMSSFCSRINEHNNGQSKNIVTISAQQGLIRQEEFFNKIIASDIIDNYYILRKGQFAYNKSYSIGYPMGAIKRLKRYDTAVVTSLYICFSITTVSANPEYFEHYFESGLLNNSLTQIAAEGGRAHGLLNVKPVDFMAISLLLPPLPEQRAIAAVLTAADREITLLEQKAAGLRVEKKALMQQLLTGKKQVSI